MSGYSRYRLDRYQRIVKDLQDAIEAMDQEEDSSAYEWASKALMIMQEKLDIESEEYYKAKEEEKADEYEWERSHQLCDPEEY